MNLLNHKAVREFALEFAARERPAAGFTRVSESFLDEIEAAVRSAVRGRVRSHPSMGVTLMGATTNSKREG